MKRRIHNFLADHVRAVQYPRENDFTVKRAPFGWKHEMPLSNRIGLTVYFAVLAAIALVAIVVLGSIGYAFIGGV